MRIIAGSIKGRRLAGPAAGDLTVRPTSDKAKEALFSILSAGPQGAFLDLFAGTGAVGLEAWSRGFLPVTCVESSPRALKLLRANCVGSDVRIMVSDVLRLRPESFSGLGIVFADPPYEESARILEVLAPRIVRWLARDGWLVWENAAKDAIAVPEGFRLTDRRKYGAAAFHFLVPS